MNILTEILEIVALNVPFATDKNKTYSVHGLIH